MPLVEEFLFRGLLQNYFGNFFGPQYRIILTSLLFAFFHYSALQGSTNIELMVGLFIYSYFIGFFYMRERSLWTPIAMHASFNALTIFIMFYVIKYEDIMKKISEAFLPYSCHLQACMAKMTYIASQNTFTFNLINALGAPQGNVCVSPYNISSALELAYFGAENGTKSEIAKTLHLPMMADKSLADRF